MIEPFLRDREIAFSTPAPGTYAFQLRGEAKLTIPVAMTMREDVLRVESFFMRAPQERHGDVYSLLLMRNARARLVWFAADTLGDLYLLSHLPAASVGEQLLDELLGELLTTADQMFNRAIELGFATYLARDLAWRRAQEAPPEKNS